MATIAGCTILTTTDAEGKTWVPVRQVCEALGKKDPGSYSRKLREKGFEIKLFRVARANGGGGWEQACIREDALPRWLPMLRGPGQDSQVYFVEAPSVGLVKIGMAQDLDKRLRDLTMMSPVPLRLLKAIPGGLKHEAAVHRLFEEHRSHGGWFHLPPIASEIASLEPFEIPEDQASSGTLPRPSACGRRGYRGRIEAALASATCQKILQAIAQEPLCISQIARSVGLTHPAVLAHIRKLEEFQLVRVTEHGQKRLVSKCG